MCVCVSAELAALRLGACACFDVLKARATRISREDITESELSRMPRAEVAALRGRGSTGPAHLTVRHKVNEVRRSNVLVGGAHAKLEQRHGQVGRGADLERAWTQRMRQPDTEVPLSHFQPKPRWFLALCRKPSRARGRNKKLCIFPRLRFRFTPKAGSKPGAV